MIVEEFSCKQRIHPLLSYGMHHSNWIWWSYRGDDDGAPLTTTDYILFTTEEKEVLSFVDRQD